MTLYLWDWARVFNYSNIPVWFVLSFIVMAIAIVLHEVGHMVYMRSVIHEKVDLSYDGKSLVVGTV
jgi:hypothetical protein